MTQTNRSQVIQHHSHRQRCESRTLMDAVRARGRRERRRCKLTPKGSAGKAISATVVLEPVSIQEYFVEFLQTSSSDRIVCDSTEYFVGADKFKWICRASSKNDLRQ